MRPARSAARGFVGEWVTGAGATDPFEVSYRDDWDTTTPGFGCSGSLTVVDNHPPTATWHDQVRHSPFHSSALYAASLRHKVRAGSVRGVFTSVVELSDHGDLMTKFLALPFPRMFMHGQENAALSYLPRLAAHGVELAAIPHSGHFPRYSNPPAMWERIGAFLARSGR